jgi:four helix bundle protein
MAFDHERLDVYQRALEVLDLCDEILEQMPLGRAHLKDQLDRAATSIVLNVAEGAGEFSHDEKCRFYRMARRSATEAAAILHLVARRRHGPEDKLRAARELLDRVVAMLVRMTKPGSRVGA